VRTETGEHRPHALHDTVEDAEYVSYNNGHASTVKYERRCYFLTGETSQLLDGLHGEINGVVGRPARGKSGFIPTRNVNNITLSKKALDFWDFQVK
jgi:hypothetical protein